MCRRYACATHASFREWIEAPFPRGIGATVELVKELCARDPKMGLAFDRAVRKGPGNQRINEQSRDKRGRVLPKDKNRSTSPASNSASPSPGSVQFILRRLDKTAEDGDERASALLDRVAKGEIRAKAADRSVDNIHGTVKERPTGTSAQAALRRLRKAAEAGNQPATALLADVIAEKVIDGKKITANSAMIEMGWRRKMISLPDDPEALFSALVSRA